VAFFCARGASAQFDTLAAESNRDALNIVGAPR
jgi:hypothetical protein